MFCQFWQKFENSKWLPILGRGNFFEIEANLCFAIFGKNSKIQNGRQFWGGEIFLKIAKSTLLRYSVGRNFDEIALSRTVKEIEANLCFAIFGEGKIF